MTNLSQKNVKQGDLEVNFFLFVEKMFNPHFGASTTKKKTFSILTIVGVVQGDIKNLCFFMSFLNSFLFGQKYSESASLEKKCGFFLLSIIILQENTTIRKVMDIERWNFFPSFVILN